MIKRLHYLAYALMFPAVIAGAAQKQSENEPKVVTGMSIVGNNETPKSLYFVPWKNSDGSREVNFSFSNLNEELKPVDKSDFIRELDLYGISKPN